MLALAADRVYAMSGVVLNPHYRSMGELYGSEYWTYTLPRRVGQTRAMELTQACQPLGAQAAREMGFLDDAFGEDAKAFEAELRARATRLAQDPEFRAMLRKKHESRLDDENIKPLASYRAEELDRMKINFFGPDPAYHEARRRFVFKGNPPPQQSRAPLSTQIKVSQTVNRKRCSPTVAGGCQLVRSVAGRQWLRTRSAAGTQRELGPEWWGVGRSLAGNAPAEGSGGSARAGSLIAPESEFYDSRNDSLSVRFPAACPRRGREPFQPNRGGKNENSDRLFVSL